MRIKTKLIISFLIVSIIPLLIGVYLSIFYLNHRLNEESRRQMHYATELLKSVEGKVFSRTYLAARFLTEDRNIQEYLHEGNYLAVRDEMIKWGNRFRESDQKVNLIEFLIPTQLYQYAQNSAELMQKTNPLWQGYTYTTTEQDVYGIMATTVSKIEYEGELLGGFKVANFIEEAIIDTIPRFTPHVHISILEPDFQADNEDEKRLYNSIFVLGEPFFSDEMTVLNNIPIQVYSQPLIGLDNKAIGAIYLGSPKSSIKLVWSEYQYQLYGLMISISSLIAIILGYLIARGFSSPLRKLLRGVNQISEGNLNYRIRTRSKDELRELADAFNTMADKLHETREKEAQIYRQDKLASLGQLSAGVAHEIRNPLQIIKTSAGILRDEFQPASKQREVAQYIIEEVNRLNNFISDFLNFARPKEPQIIPIRIDDILERTIKLAQTQFSPDIYPIEINLLSQNELVAADPNQIQQVFLNLILNACQSMPEGGTLKISYDYDRNKKLLGITFQDEGKGIPDDEQKKIFDPFYTTRQDGTGLGLSVVNQIIAQHKGKIELISKIGKGTKISVYLPLADT